MATHDLDPLQTQDRPDEAFETSWRRGFRRRLLIIGVVFGLWTVGIQARLVFLQVVAHPRYLEQANDQQMRVFEPAAKRGDLLDRNGEVLAYSVDADTISVNPRVVKDAQKTVAALCKVFRDCTAQERESLVEAVSNRKFAFAYIRRGVAPGIGPRVAALKLPGVEVRVESKRYYPNRGMGAHLIGFVGRDNNGLGGIEQVYDSVVRGKKGRVLMLTDARHASVESRVELEATAGASLELTIDQYLQHIAERELRAGVEKHNATAGTLVALDPNTGEILALANYPPFNPNAPNDVDADVRRNRAVQEVYEPGSTFKMVTAAAAIEEGLLTADSLIETQADPRRALLRAADDLSRHHREVEQRRRDQGGLADWRGATQSLRAPFWFRRNSRAGLPGRLGRQSVAARGSEPVVAGLGLDGVSGFGHADADGGGHRGHRQRRDVV